MTSSNPHERRSFLLRRRLRKLSRLRFYRKQQNLRAYRISPVHRAREYWGYLLFDPEIENFTYELCNVDELVDFLAASLRAERGEVEGYVQELLEDDRLRSELDAKTRPRFSMKNHLGYGRRVARYALLRVASPSLVVETGIHDGLGSAVILSALARNAEDGRADGHLYSFDPAPDAGWLVPPRLRGRWSPVWETSDAALERTLDGKVVDALIHDSSNTYETAEFEFRTALEHGASDLILVSEFAHGANALRDIAEEMDAPYTFFAEVPKDHWYPGAGVGLVRRAGAVD